MQGPRLLGWPSDPLVQRGKPVEGVGSPRASGTESGQDVCRPPVQAQRPRPPLVSLLVTLLPPLTRKGVMLFLGIPSSVRALSFLAWFPEASQSQMLQAELLKLWTKKKGNRPMGISSAWSDQPRRLTGSAGNYGPESEQRGSPGLAFVFQNLPSSLIPCKHCLSVSHQERIPLGGHLPHRDFVF